MIMAAPCRNKIPDHFISVILDWIDAGKSNEEIACRIELAASTIQAIRSKHGRPSCPYINQRYRVSAQLVAENEPTKNPLPTDTLPGTLERVLTLANRAAADEQLFFDEDKFADLS